VAAWRLGAGRARKEDAVSATAGVICHAKVGDRVTAGQPLLELRTDEADRFGGAREALEGAWTIGSGPATPPALVLDRITA
jgi:thymidine phosphorylase